MNAKNHLSLGREPINRRKNTVNYVEISLV
jgi:hypothetical protein